MRRQLFRQAALNDCRNTDDFKGVLCEMSKRFLNKLIGIIPNTKNEPPQIS